jgi:hypothetical protein
MRNTRTPPMQDVGITISEIFLTKVGAHIGVFRTIFAEAKDAEKIHILSVLEGRAIAQAVSSWLPAAAARVQTRV